MRKTSKEKRLEMAKLSSEYSAMGIKKFPKEYLEKYCPKKKPLDIHNWFVSANNVWNLRNVDESIIKIFKKLYQDLINEIDVN